MEHPINTHQNAPSPAEMLAEQIFQQLVRAGILSPDETPSTFVRKMAKGEMRDSDWSVALNPSLKTQKPDDHETPKT
jgi:hypothetical protein